MTTKELRKRMQAALNRFAAHDDNETLHDELDKLLLAYVNDDEVTRLFNQETLWYS